TPSQTPTQTLTPTVTPTQTGLPTLTPAKAQALSGNYDLRQWSVEQADYMARLMEDYPDTLPASARGEDNSAYFDAFEYAVVAFKEALLRYPDEPQASQWRWDLAYTLARMGDEAAGEQYASLIADGLNRGDVDIDYLYAWLPAKELRLALYMIELQPISGYTASYLLEVRGEASGSVFLWLLQTPSAYKAYPLLTRFDFLNAPQANWIVADLNGNPQDGKEVAIYFAPTPGDHWLGAPRVFNLGRVPAREMPFLPEEAIFNVGLSFDNYWAVRSDPVWGNQLEFRSRVFPACPLTIRRQYRWNGLYFALVEEEYRLSSEASATPYCAVIVDHAAHTWGPAAAISLMEALLPAWPPSLDEQGAPYPQDARDEWRYRLGVYYALVGEAGLARSAMNELVAQPSMYNSRWITPARAFLAAYQAPEDIYQACVQSAYCDPAQAIAYLVDHLPPGEKDALHYLWARGLNSNSSGYFDFDGDEDAERWFTARHRTREKPQFWILSAYEGGLRALYVADVDSIPPTLDHLEAAYVADESLGLMPVSFLDGALAFSMQRLPDTQAPYLVSVTLRAEYPNRFFEGLDSAVKSLFSSTPPALVQKQLENLQDNPGLLCRTNWQCDSYYYFLGLASELAGDERAAVEAYHRLWLDYSKSPYALMGRLKLYGEAYHTPTPTPTLTPTGATTSPTPTTSGTPATTTPTPTVSGTPATGTPTPTITAAISGTPNTPTPTPTPTPTATEDEFPGITNTPSYP
ncbi:MAG: hypothetical protein JXA78_19935, partial [Anaerolineales bacterium]|nr:hypothetical protein [Anaerolineales bacterium]